MKQDNPRHVVIIGNGVAGVTTALSLRRRDPRCRITLVSGESDHFFSRPALMYIFMGHMKFEHTKPYEDSTWAAKGIDLLRAWVTGVDITTKTLALAPFEGPQVLRYDQLVVATGSQPNRFGWPGQDLEGVGGFYSLADLKYVTGHSPRIKRVVIVGGGLIGIEMAEMLHSRGKAVTILARESAYWSNALPTEESAMVGRAIEASGIDLRLNTELAEIVDDGQGRVCAVITKDGERIDCEFVGLSAGVRPNLSALAGSEIETGRGVLVDFQMRTNVPDVFAVGDCAELVTGEGERNRIEALWYTGKMHGEICAANLCGEVATYERGIWFNSAKFIDLEWHTYGQVPGSTAPKVPGRRDVYWEAERGSVSGGDACLRLVLDGDTLVGVNAMGLRYRHRICERWIREARSLAYVIEHLEDAHFDPELHRRHTAAIVRTLKEALR